jgi:hypothetical protein
MSLFDIGALSLDACPSSSHAVCKCVSTQAWRMSVKEHIRHRLTLRVCVTLTHSVCACVLS